MHSQLINLFGQLGGGSSVQPTTVNIRVYNVPDEQVFYMRLEESTHLATFEIPTDINFTNSMIVAFDVNMISDVELGTGIKANLASFNNAACLPTPSYRTPSCNKLYGGTDFSNGIPTAQDMVTSSVHSGIYYSEIISGQMEGVGGTMGGNNTCFQGGDINPIGFASGYNYYAIPIPNILMSDTLTIFKKAPGATYGYCGGVYAIGLSARVIDAFPSPYAARWQSHSLLPAIIDTGSNITADDYDESSLIGLYDIITDHFYPIASLEESGGYISKQFAKLAIKQSSETSNFNYLSGEVKTITPDNIYLP